MPGNDVLIVDAVRAGRNQASKKDVAERTGIPWATMCKAANRLLSRGVLHALPGEPVAPGRPSVPLGLDAEYGYWCGVDVGSSGTRLVICDMNFAVLCETRLPTERFSGAERFYAWIGDVFGRAAAACAPARGKLLGVGLAVSGRVDSDEGVVVSGGNWGAPEGANLEAARLAEDLGVPVYMVTTQAAAVCAEYHFGARRGCGNLVTIGLGVGIGSGVIANHRLLVSHPRRPVGYIGHILVPGNRQVCTCGFTGCLEAFSGGEFLGAVARRKWPKRNELHTAAGLDRAAAAGDRSARQLLEAAAGYNAAGVAAMIQMYLPEALVFSGAQSRVDGFLYQGTIRQLREILPRERRDFHVETTTLGDLQSARGAARLAYERFF